MTNAAEHLAAGPLHDIGGVFFQILSERVVGGEEEPAVEALLDGGQTGDVRLRKSVEDIMHGVGSAGFVREPDRPRTVEHDDLVARLCDLAGGERGGGSRDIDDGLDALIVEHIAGDIGGKIGLVEVIGRDDLDFAAQNLAADIFGRHLRRRLAARAGDVGVKPGHIEDGAELERRLTLRRRAGGDQQRGENAGENLSKNSFHLKPPLVACRIARAASAISIAKDHAACGRKRQAATASVSNKLFAQKNPTIEPIAITTTSAITAPTIPTMTISR